MLELLASFFTSTNVLITALFILLTFYLWSHYKVTSGLPPGPKGLPIIGYLPYLKRHKLHVQLRDIADKYGDIFCVYFGRRPAIVLNSYDAIKEAFVKHKDVFSARAFKSNMGNIPSIFTSEGEYFRDHKRFILGTLKEFGLGKNNLEPRIQEEIREMIKVISSLNEQPTDIGNLLKMSVSNVICTLMNGKRYEYDDKVFQNIIHLVGKLIADSNFFASDTVFRGLRKIPGFVKLKNRFFRSAEVHAQGVMDQLQEHVDKRRLLYESGQKNDLINAWFTEKEQREQLKTDENFSDKHLARVVESLFIAGTDTTANSLRWALMYLIANPEIQARIHQEIDDVVGHERMPSHIDRERLPHVEATLLEIQRITSLVPLGITHSNFEETKLRNYTIPKRSIIIPNLWAVHHDPTIYPEPEKFLPFQRFLDASGNVTRTSHPLLLRFNITLIGTSKRQCLGKPLAEMELFLYFTAMFQRFEFKLPNDESLTFDYDTSVVITPKPLKIIAVDRKKILHE